jgi:predicted metalloprotease
MRTSFVRLASIMMAFWMAVLLVPAVVAQQGDTAQVERVVIDLVRAEGNGDYSLLYDYMAPESRDLVPRQAFVSWSLAQDRPLPAAPPEVISIDFADGEYETTGTDYENLASVELAVTLDTGDVETREMLLVSDGLTWRWFLDLPEDEIDDIVEEVSDFTVEYETLYRTEMYQQLDLFWAQVFADYGAPYRSPIDMVAVNVYPTRTACGEFDKEGLQNSGAIYCGLDETIYFDMELRDWFYEEFGEYGWHQVIAHEWGHHIQKVAGLFTSMDPELYGGAYTIEHELQADCLAAMFTQDLRARGLIRNRDVSNAEGLTEWIGDMEGTPWDEANAHGTSEQRVEAFWLGYDDGLRGCYVNISSLAD